jgi:hypothetical protein
VVDQLARLDPRDERGVEAQDAVEAQDVGDQVVGEERQAVELLELGGAGEREVGGRDLRALEERDLATVVGRAVGEAVPGGQQLDERGGRAPRRLDDAEEAAAVLVGDASAEIVECAGEERDQLVLGVLAERRGDRRGVDRAQLLGAPRPVRTEAVAQAERASRLRSVGNQPEPKLIASSVRKKAARSSAGPSTTCASGSRPGSCAGGGKAAAYAAIASSRTTTRVARRATQAAPLRISSTSTSGSLAGAAAHGGAACMLLQRCWAA